MDTVISRINFNLRLPWQIVVFYWLFLKLYSNLTNFLTRSKLVLYQLLSISILKYQNKLYKNANFMPTLCKVGNVASCLCSPQMFRLQKMDFCANSSDIQFIYHEIAHWSRSTNLLVAILLPVTEKSCSNLSSWCPNIYHKDWMDCCTLWCGIAWKVIKKFENKLSGRIRF